MVRTDTFQCKTKGKLYKALAIVHAAPVSLCVCALTRLNVRLVATRLSGLNYLTRIQRHMSQFRSCSARPRGGRAGGPPHPYGVLSAMASCPPDLFKTGMTEHINQRARDVAVSGSEARTLTEAVQLTCAQSGALLDVIQSTGAPPLLASEWDSGPTVAPRGNGGSYNGYCTSDVRILGGAFDSAPSPVLGVFMIDITDEGEQSEARPAILVGHADESTTEGERTIGFLTLLVDGVPLARVEADRFGNRLSEFEHRLYAALEGAERANVRNEGLAIARRQLAIDPLDQGPSISTAVNARWLTTSKEHVPKWDSLRSSLRSESYYDKLIHIGSSPFMRLRPPSNDDEATAMAAHLYNWSEVEKRVDLSHLIARLPPRQAGGAEEGADGEMSDPRPPHTNVALVRCFGCELSREDVNQHATAQLPRLVLSTLFRGIHATAAELPDGNFTATILRDYCRSLVVDGSSEIADMQLADVADLAAIILLFSDVQEGAGCTTPMENTLVRSTAEQATSNTPRDDRLFGQNFSHTSPMTDLLSPARAPDPLTQKERYPSTLITDVTVAMSKREDLKDMWGSHQHTLLPRAQHLIANADYSMGLEAIPCFAEAMNAAKVRPDRNDGARHSTWGSVVNLQSILGQDAPGADDDKPVDLILEHMLIALGMSTRGIAQWIVSLAKRQPWYKTTTRVPYEWQAAFFLLRIAKIAARPNQDEEPSVIVRWLTGRIDGVTCSVSSGTGEAVLVRLCPGQSSDIMTGETPHFQFLRNQDDLLRAFRDRRVPCVLFRGTPAQDRDAIAAFALEVVWSDPDDGQNATRTQSIGRYDDARNDRCYLARAVRALERTSLLFGTNDPRRFGTLPTFAQDGEGNTAPSVRATANEGACARVEHVQCNVQAIADEIGRQVVQLVGASKRRHLDECDGGQARERELVLKRLRET